MSHTTNSPKILPTTTEREYLEVREALIDVLDMLGALSGGSYELEGWGLSEERCEEIWALGQRILKDIRS